MKQPRLTIIGVNDGIETAEGETIEQAVSRLINNNEPIDGQTPLIYTERKDGVRAEMNIRTDRWEIAVEAMDKVAASYKARREERIKSTEPKTEDKTLPAGEGGGEGKP